MHYTLILLIVLLQPTCLAASGVIIAVRSGNFNAVKYAVGAATNINATDSAKRNALHYAAILGDLDIVDYLLANNANPKQKDSNNKVPFQLAIEPKMTIKRAKLASVLLHATKGVHGRDEKGWTALHWAILAKDRALIDRWLDDGATLLRYGSMIGRQHPIEVVFLTQDTNLIEYVIDRYEEWKENTALWTAVNAKLYELVAALIKRGHNLADTEGHISNQSLTRAAVNQHHAEILELLLANGAPVDDQQPLIEAVRQRKPDLAKLLIEYGTDLKITNAHDLYSLLVTGLRSRDEKLFAKIVATTVANNSELQSLPAIARAHSGEYHEFEEIVDALLEQGADINARENDSEYTALYYAIKNRASYIVSTLIVKGADIEMRINGKTPLMLAATMGEPDIVQVLLRVKADVHATVVEENEERDALSFARQSLAFEEKHNPFNSPKRPKLKRVIALLEKYQRL